MTGRPAQTVIPLDLRADFAAAPSSAHTDVRLDAAEFAALLAEAREAGAAAARRETDPERLERAAEHVGQCLKDLAALAGVLERAALDADARARSDALIKSTCQSLIDGQGDLFAPPGARPRTPR